MSDLDRPRRRSRKLTEAGPRKSQRLSSLAGPAEVYPHGETSQQHPRGGGEKEMEKKKEGREKPMTQEQKSAARQEPLQAPQTIEAFLSFSAVRDLHFLNPRLHNVSRRS